MHHIYLRTWLLAAAVAILTGCSSTESENVRSEGISANFWIVAGGDGKSDVTANLDVGSSGLNQTELELSAGDSLVALANGMQKTLKKESDFLGGYAYTSTFDFNTGGTEFIISFYRQNDTSAPNSRVTLPTGTSLIFPSANTVYQRGDNVTVTWQPSGEAGNINLNFVTRCPADTFGAEANIETNSLPDTGTFTISTHTLIGKVADGLSGGERYSTEMEWSRAVSGTLDPNYGEGGTIFAKQIRNRSITILL